MKDEKHYVAARLPLQDVDEDLVFVIIVRSFFAFGAIWEGKSAILDGILTPIWYHNEVLGLTLGVLGLTLEVKNEVWRRKEGNTEKT